MLHCPKCGEPVAAVESRQIVAFRHFRGTWTTWQELFQEAAEFAGSVGPDRLISISHSDDHSDGVVTVWYWSDGQ